MTQSAIDNVLENRWSDVVELVAAFHEFEDKAIANLENHAGPIVAAMLNERGFELETQGRWGEFLAFKPGWKKSDGEPAAKLAIGGLFPSGLGSVDTDAPYLWVYLKLDRTKRSEVAQLIRDGVRNDAAWLHPETNDRQPLGRYLPEAAADRLKFARDPQALADFVLNALPDVLGLEGLVFNSLRSVAGVLA